MAGGAETSTSQRGTPSLYLPRTPGRQASMLPRKFHAARLHGAMTEHAYRSPRRVFNGSFAPNIAVLLMVAEFSKAVIRATRRIDCREGVLSVRC